MDGGAGNLAFLRAMLIALMDDKKESSRLIEKLTDDLRKERERMGEIGYAIMQIERDIREHERGDES